MATTANTISFPATWTIGNTDGGLMSTTTTGSIDLSTSTYTYEVPTVPMASSSFIGTFGPKKKPSVADRLMAKIIIDDLMARYERGEEFPDPMLPWPARGWSSTILSTAAPATWGISPVSWTITPSSTTTGTGSAEWWSSPVTYSYDEVDEPAAVEE